MLGLRKEVEEGAPVEVSLADLAALEELLAAAVEGALEEGEEGEGLGSEDLALVVLDGTEDVDALEDGFGRGHCECEEKGGWMEGYQITR